MAYEPTNWKAGDVVTSAKLNKLEQGVAAGGGVFAVHANADGEFLVLDKTYQQIVDAIDQGLLPVVHFPQDSEDGLQSMQTVNLYGHNTGTDSYDIFVYNVSRNTRFVTDSADGYPTYPERASTN